MYYNILYHKTKNEIDCDGSNMIISKGGYGTIYKKIIDINNKSYYVAIKEQKINKNRFKIISEYNILKKCTELVLKQVTQNLPMIYDMLICKNVSKTLFYNELASGDFIDWCYMVHTEEEWTSFLFQFWAGLYVLQKHLKLVHNDLRLGNVLYYKIEKNNSYWKYKLDDDEYYIPNIGYVFVISDFGSANLINSEKDVNKKKLDLNIDLHFFHDIYNRLRVLLITELYSTEELEQMFASEKEIEYLKEKKQECHKRFGKDLKRQEEKYKISLSYFLIENGRFDELAKKETTKNIIKMPPIQIMDILKKLSDTNYDYDSVIKIIHNPTLNIDKKIPSPNMFIKKYLKQYEEKHPYDFEFIA